MSCLCTMFSSGCWYCNMPHEARKEYDRLHPETKQDPVDYERIRKMAMALIESADRTFEKSFVERFFLEQERKQEVVMTWISIEDRLPEDDQMVFGTNVNVKMNPVLCNYVARGNIFESYESFKCVPCDVTHWMPIPAQPEVSDEV